MVRVFFTLMLGMLVAGANAAGDAERGKPLTTTCVACHSEDGNSPAGSFPNIAGQHGKYLYKQLKDIQSGARSAPLMAGQLDNMSDQDLLDIAAFYATQTGAQGAAKPELAELGESIYRHGIKRKSIAACSTCHSPSGSGNGPASFPSLAGQWSEYTEAQLKAFRSGTRNNDGDTRMMRMTAMDLSDDEIAAVASYIRGLR